MPVSIVADARILYPMVVHDGAEARFAACLPLYVRE
jgi:hypothetical protein